MAKGPCDQWQITRDEPWPGREGSPYTGHANHAKLFFPVAMVQLHINPRSSIDLDPG